MLGATVARWRVEFRIYRNDRLAYRGSSGEWSRFRDAVHMANSDMENADKEIDVEESQVVRPGGE